MNLAHAHLLLNHFPTVGMIVGLGVFLVALSTKGDDLKRASLVIFFLIALLAIPAFVTGTAAHLVLQHAHATDVSESQIQTHETAAFEALWFMELTGALAWLGLWQYRRSSRWPQGTLAAVLLAGLATFGMMTRAANIGGELRHPEIRADPATAEAAAADPPASSAQDPAGDPPLARKIGDEMVNLKWGWPA